MSNCEASSSYQSSKDGEEMHKISKINSIIRPPFAVPKKILEHFSSAEILEFVERVAPTAPNQQFLLRKHVIGNLEIFISNDKPFYYIKPDTALMRIFSEFSAKFTKENFGDGVFVNEYVLCALFRNEIYQRKSSLLSTIGGRYQSIMDGANSWIALGVDVGSLPNFLLLLPIYETTNTFGLSFDIEPKTFSLEGKHFSFVEPMHYNAFVDCHQHDTLKSIRFQSSAHNCIMIGTTFLEFESECLRTLHLKALQLLRKVCVQKMEEEYLSKYGKPVDNKRITKQYHAKVEYGKNSTIVTNLLKWVVHHLGIYKENVQDLKYPEVIPVVLDLLNRHKKSRFEFAADILKKGSVFQDLLKVMKYMNETPCRSRHDSDSKNISTIPGLIKCLETLTLDESIDQVLETLSLEDSSLPECEEGDDDTEDDRSLKKRSAESDTLRPDEECKKKPAG